MSEINIEQLIESIKENEILWNLNHPFYKHIKKKAKAWRAVAEECDTSVNKVKKKWKGLRDSFTRDIHRSLINLQEGEEVHRWRYTRHMQFLQAHLRSRHSIKNYESDAEETRFLQTFDAKNNSSADTMTIETFYNEYTSASPITADCKHNNEHIDMKNVQITDEDDDDDDNDDDDDAENVVHNDDVENLVDENEELADDDADDDDDDDENIHTAVNDVVINDQDQSSLVFVNTKNYNTETATTTTTRTTKTTPASKRIKLDVEKNLIDTMNSLKDVLMKSQQGTVITIPTSLNCEDELYCRSMMEKITKFPLRKKNEAKLKFMEYLCEMEAEIERERNDC